MIKLPRKANMKMNKKVRKLSFIALMKYVVCRTDYSTLIENRITIRKWM